LTAVPIRARLTLLCVVAALVVLAAVGLVFVVQLRTGLDHNLDLMLRSRAETAITQVTGAEGSDFQDSGTGSLLCTTDAFAQVLGSSNQVLAASDGQRPGSLLSAAQRSSAATRPLTFDTVLTLPAGSGRAAGDGGPEAVRLLAAPAGRTGKVVVVGTSREVVDAAVSRARRQLLQLGSLVLLLAGAGAYLLGRAALRPVELMRAQAEELQSGDASVGLAVPRTRDELSRLATTMNALLSRLHGALERERGFVADAGHELRTPLTVLKGELELAQRPGRTEQQLRATVGVAAQETERLIRLSEDLLLLAAAQQEQFLRLANTDLAQLVRVAVAAAQGLAGRRDVILLAVPHDAVRARADADRVRQALDNLIINALRYAPVRSVVRVAVGGDEASVCLWVSDDGPGFPPEFLSQAFERFQRADPARVRADLGQDAAGTGLGLAIVRGIAVAHGGSVQAVNRPGGGAEVSFTLLAAGPSS